MCIRDRAYAARSPGFTVNAPRTIVPAEDSLQVSGDSALTNSAFHSACLLYTSQCSMHYIRYDVLYAYVLSRLQYWSGLVQHDEERLLKRLLNANDKGQVAARKKQAAELNKAEKRKAEVDTLFARMYEDWAAGRITEYNFSMLSGKYQSEQAELDEKIERLQSAIATESQNAADAEK